MRGLLPESDRIDRWTTKKREYQRSCETEIVVYKGNTEADSKDIRQILPKIA